jgi:2-polyprenyl-3-methyl-5-hydroxy-6-metoxy-1,4-benzoquinol methylase
MSTIYGKTFNKNNLSESHKKILELGGKNNTILELGCASGYLTEHLNQNGNIVDIVEQDRDDAEKAGKFARKSYIGDLEDPKFLSQIQNDYDVVIAADVLEHLAYPEKTLIFIKRVLKKGGYLIVSLPNIASWPIRKELFFKGKFEYTETGILDKTHLRFFTFYTLQNFLKSDGFNIDEIYKMEIFYPFRNTILKIPILGKLADSVLKPFFISSYPNLSVSHMVVKANTNE